MNALTRELWFLVRDKAVCFWLLLSLICASSSIYFGMLEVQAQQRTIAELQQADETEQQVMAAKYQEWGMTAYYTFHLTYAPPSGFAFVALGQRDVQPWKHRVRMLALEGQIYEADTQNPDFALLGRFDYAFVVAILLPLFVIFLLYDLRASERINGRFELIDSIDHHVWLTRASLRVALLILSFLLPLWGVSLMQNVAFLTIVLASLIVIGYALIWALIVTLCARRFANVNHHCLSVLVAVWFALAIVIPGGLKVGVDSVISVPDTGELLMTQREAVNDAWDLPVAQTMEPFIERHPQWAAYTQMDSTFEWKWYYAFQQVGDQVAEPLLLAYRDGRKQRDELASLLSWLAPPAKVERLFQALAQTDMNAYIDYENQIRSFHHDLRQYYYPKVFKELEYSQSELNKRPKFVEGYH